MSNTIATTSRVGRPSAIETILTAGFIAGCLDLLTAILVYSVAMQRTTDTKLLQGIGRAAFGSNAFDSETSLALSGVAVHFFIAFSFAIFYFFIFSSQAKNNQRSALWHLCMVCNESCCITLIAHSQCSAQMGFNDQGSGDTDVLYWPAYFFNCKQVLCIKASAINFSAGFINCDMFLRKTKSEA
jgi:hypothetical protein